MRVALVLPAGSRLATSRINFRLLAREAQSHAHDLCIVAPEAATRALAASAGLAVYATVRDLEEAMEGGDATGAGPEAARAGRLAGAPTAGAPSPGARPQDRGTGNARRRHGPTRRRGARDPAIRRRPARPRPTAAPAMSGPGAAWPGAARSPTCRSCSGVGRRGDRRPGWLVPLAIIVVVAFVGGFAGAQILPAATIVVTPKVEPVGPLTFDITADPTATAPDVTAGIVPATKPEFPLEATDDFPATGRKVTETKATGTVTFSNLDPSASNSIPAGSIVATQSNRQFVTKESLFLPKADPRRPARSCRAPGTWP